MKKFKARGFAMVLAIVMVAATLSGCTYGSTVASINPDGSGRVIAELGMSKEILDQLGKKMSDFTSKKNESKIVTVNGKKYEVETYGDAFLNPEEIHWSAGMSMINDELGPVTLINVYGGLRLELGLFDEYGPNMKAEHVLPKSVKSITDASIAGMTLPDLIAQNADGLILKVTFNMPYDVKQVAGGTTGVSVSGKTITLDYVKMAKSGDHAWTFDSVKSIPKDAFKDVDPKAWYADAVNALAAGGIVNGDGKGNFDPNGNLTLAQLCKIIAVGHGENLGNANGYWAANWINYAVSHGYVAARGAVSGKNWDVQATREQAVVALTLASGRQVGSDAIKSGSIKDWNSITAANRETVLWAYNLGIVQGNPDGTFKPKSSITRAELCQMMYNAHWTVPKSDVGKSGRDELVVK